MTKQPYGLEGKKTGFWFMCMHKDEWCTEPSIVQILELDIIE